LGDLNISTYPRGPIVSFHPLVRGHANFWAFTALDDEVLGALEGAKAVLWPQVLPVSLYRYVRKRGLPCFPNYDVRLNFPGKDGQLLLFRALGLPHPGSVLVPKIAAFGSHPETRPIELTFPVVLKIPDEHEGQGVYLIEKEEEWPRYLALLKERERTGRFGFILQEFVPSSFDLRVFVIGRKRLPFWRRKGKDFRGNLVQGGEYVSCPSQELEDKALELVNSLLTRTGIDLAAVDFLVGEEGVFFNEINFVFAHRALKGLFEEYFFEALKDFLERI